MIMYSRGGVKLDVCAYCSCSLDEFSRTLDHLTPKSRGGILSNTNKVPSCVSCNRLKGDMNLVEFGRALNSLLFNEVSNHKREVARLKRIKWNVESIINNGNGNRERNEKRGVGYGVSGSGQSGKHEKKRL